MVDPMNPKSLCRFTCEQYNNGRPRSVIDTTTIFEHKTKGVNCNDLDLEKYNRIYVLGLY